MQKEERFKKLFDTYADMVYNVCLNYLSNKENAEDVTQNTFVSVYENLDRFNSKSSYKTWIYRIAINMSLDFIKASNTKKRKGTLLPLFQKKEDTIYNYEPQDFNHPGVLLEDKEDLGELMSKINTLPKNQKTALLLKATEDLSIDEIAEIMEMKNKAVNSLLVRARTNLRNKLNDPKFA